MANRNNMVWCNQCNRYHFYGSKAYKQCFNKMQQPRNKSRQGIAAVLGTPTRETRSTITATNAPIEDDYGNSYQFDSNNVINIKDSTIVDSHYYVNKGDINVHETTIRSATIAQETAFDNSDIRQGIWKNSIITNTDSSGNVNSESSDIDGCTITHYGSSDNSITISESSLKNAAITGNRIVIRKAGLHNTEQKNNTQLTINANSPRLLAISESIINGDSEGERFTLTTSGNAETSIRNSVINGDTTIYTAGNNTKAAIASCYLNNVHIVTTEDLRIERSYINFDMPYALPTAPNGTALNIKGALISSPEHITEWRDQHASYGWMYRSIPSAQAQEGDSPTVTFVTYQGNSRTYDEADLFLYLHSTTTETPISPENPMTADTIIAQTVQQNNMKKLLTPLTSKEAKEYKNCLII